MSYSVKVTVTSKGGATVYALNVPTGDDTPGNVAAAYGLADPLIITQALSSDARLPMSHPEPDEATVAIIAPDATTYGDMDLGDPIAVQLYPQAAYAGTPVQFFGRIAALQGDPHDLGVKLTLSCVDYTADLAELPIGATAYPVERADLRLARIVAEAGLPAFGFNGLGAITAPQGMLVAARPAGTTDLYSHLRDLLDTMIVGPLTDENGTALTTPPGHYIPMRTYLVQKVTGGLLDPITPFSLQIGKPYTRRFAYAPPYRLVNVAGTYSVQVSAADSSPTTGAPILDGGRVAFAPTFTKVKGGGLPNVTLATDAQGDRYVWDWRSVNNSWATGGAYWGPGGWIPYGFSSPANASAPQNIQEITSILDATNGGGPALVASFLAEGYRVPFRPDPFTSWGVGTMTWQAWSEPSPWRRPDLTELLTVARAQVGKLPNQREWVSGLVIGTTVRVERGRPTVDIDLAPPSYDFVGNREDLGASLGVVSMDSPIISGVTLAQVKARDTLNDYSMVRGT